MKIIKFMGFPFKMKLLLVLIFLLYMNLASATISFFEEFPDDEVLEKVGNINFDTKIYLATKNLQEFSVWEKKFKNSNVYIKEVVYWPILSKKEGYWISPWSDNEALKRIFEEIEERSDKKQLTVMLDLEPSLDRERLFKFRNFIKNKRYIKKFILDSEKYNVDIITVEKSHISDIILKPLGLSFNSKKYPIKKIKMYYSSYQRRTSTDSIIDKLFEKKMKSYRGKQIMVGLGLIGTGIHDETHRLSPEILKKEIEIAFKYGIKEVIIFRLGGLNDEYLKVLRE
jgi:hypothetical protein